MLRSSNRLRQNLIPQFCKKKKKKKICQKLFLKVNLISISLALNRAPNFNYIVSLYPQRVQVALKLYLIFKFMINFGFPLFYHLPVHVWVSSPFGRLDGPYLVRATAFYLFEGLRPRS